MALHIVGVGNLDGLAMAIPGRGAKEIFIQHHVHHGGTEGRARAPIFYTLRVYGINRHIARRPFRWRCR